MFIIIYLYVCMYHVNLLSGGKGGDKGKSIQPRNAEVPAKMKPGDRSLAFLTGVEIDTPENIICKLIFNIFLCMNVICAVLNVICALLNVICALLNVHCHLLLLFLISDSATVPRKLQNTNWVYEVSDVVVTFDKTKLPLLHAIVQDVLANNRYRVQFMDGFTNIRKGTEMNLVFRFPK